MKLRNIISAGQSTLDVFESACAEARAMLHDLKASEFEVVDVGASRPVDAEHYPEDVLNSSATEARSTSRVSAERIKHAEECGKACTCDWYVR